MAGMGKTRVNRKRFNQIVPASVNRIRYGMTIMEVDCESHLDLAKALLSMYKSCGMRKIEELEQVANVIVIYEHYNEVLQDRMAWQERMLQMQKEDVEHMDMHEHFDRNMKDEDFRLIELYVGGNYCGLGCVDAGMFHKDLSDGRGKATIYIDDDDED